MPKSETHLIDCLTFMRSLPDKAFSLAIVDPPYGIGNFSHATFENKASVKRNGYRVTRGKWVGNIHWNNEIPPVEYFEQLKRISQERIIWGANYYNCFEGKNGAIIWDKEMPHPNMSRCEIASYSRLAQVKYVNIKWQSLNRNEYNYHPCQKPVALYKWLLQNYAKQGDTIFDSHLGSQSSRIAAWDLGFDFVGCELDVDYFNSGNERFENHRKQPNLFFSEVKIANQDSLFSEVK